MCSGVFGTRVNLNLDGFVNDFGKIHLSNLFWLAVHCASTSPDSILTLQLCLPRTNRLNDTILVCICSPPGSTDRCPFFCRAEQVQTIPYTLHDIILRLLCSPSGLPQCSGFFASSSPKLTHAWGVHAWQCRCGMRPLTHGAKTSHIVLQPFLHPPRCRDAFQLAPPLRKLPAGKTSLVKLLLLDRAHENEIFICRAGFTG